MKKLTLDLYERIIKTFHEQTRNNLKLLGHITPDECAEYIGFYAYHGGLFWCERNGKVTAIATGHPGKKHFDWEWEPDEGIWTTHCIWASDKRDIPELIREFLTTYSVKQFYACRRGSLDHLTAGKLERILSYGRRRKPSTATSSTTVQRVNEGHPQGSGRTCPSTVREGSGISTEVPSTSSTDPSSIGEGSDEAVSGASTGILQP